MFATAYFFKVFEKIFCALVTLILTKFILFLANTAFASKRVNDVVKNLRNSNILLFWEVILEISNLESFPAMCEYLVKILA